MGVGMFLRLLRQAFPCFLFLLVAVGCNSQATETATETDVPEFAREESLPVAFLGVTVIPMDSERVLEDQTVIVQDGIVAQITDAVDANIPDGAVLVDGDGKYLLPGLAEMHGHIPPPNDPEEFVEAVLFMYVANGITTVRGMLGAPGQLELRERVRRGDLIGPNLYLAGPSFSGGSINSPEEAVARVRSQAGEGWDLLKVHPGLTRAEYDAMAETANELGMRFGGHVPAEVGLRHALDMGQETFDHLDGYLEHLDATSDPIEESQLADIVERTRNAGAWVVPTMALWETLVGTRELDALTRFEELRYMPPDEVEEWADNYRSRVSAADFDPAAARRLIDNRMRVLAALNDGGVPVLMGTDAPQQFSVPGFSIHRELAVMSAAGMSPYEILQSGTANVGRYFSNQDDFGTIEVGQRADLLLVNADPLEDIRNVRDRAGVMVRGEWLPESSIQERLDAIAALYN